MMATTMKLFCLLFVVSLMMTNKFVWGTLYEADNEVDIENRKLNLAEMQDILLDKRYCIPSGATCGYDRACCSSICRRLRHGRHGRGILLHRRRSHFCA
jgi:hypothetical protein